MNSDQNEAEEPIEEPRDVFQCNIIHTGMYTARMTPEALPHLPNALAHIARDGAAYAQAKEPLSPLRLLLEEVRAKVLSYQRQHEPWRFKVE